ncbi:MAG: hypothetical protein K9L17_12460 [Clostridiales bacterium]|nr:hypothetical protein [Clostridiales bacterium]
MFLKNESFVRLSLRTCGMIFRETIGTDKFYNNAYLLTGKRLSGTGRFVDYCNPFIPGFQAKPGAFINVKEESLDDISLVIETNLILSPALLRENTGIKIINRVGKTLNFPLKRPDVEINWDGKKRFVVPLTDFIYL